jgi:hypothetical protein
MKISFTDHKNITILFITSGIKGQWLESYSPDHYMTYITPTEDMFAFLNRAVAPIA